MASSPIEVIEVASLTTAAMQLSLKHGILTPYTSFLADERTNLTARADNAGRATDQLRVELQENASGQKGFAQRAKSACGLR